MKIYAVDECLAQDDLSKISLITKNLSLPLYLINNLSLSIAALNFFKIPYRQENFQNSKLFGRLTRFKSNILLDVGHNTLAAKAIFNALKGKKYILVYNSYKDKNYKEIFSILKPIINYVEIIRVEDNRIEKYSLLQKSLDNLDIEYRDFSEIQESQEYLVFGSFSVVEAFLRSQGE